MGIPNVFGKLWVLILDSGGRGNVKSINQHLGTFYRLIFIHFRIVYNDVVGILNHFPYNDPRAVIG